MITNSYNSDIYIMANPLVQSRMAYFAATNMAEYDLMYHEDLVRLRLVQVPSKNGKVKILVMEYPLVN